MHIKMSFINLQGGTVVNADHQIKADVLIKGGLIINVGAGLKASSSHQRAELSTLPSRYRTNIMLMYMYLEPAGKPWGSDH